VGFVLPEGDSRYYNRAMPATDEENVAPQSPKSQKDGWDRSDIISKWVSAIAAVAVPIVILVGSCQIQKSVAEQSVQVQKSIAQQSLAKDYVGFAISILERPEQEGNSDLREWATKLLVHHAPEGDEFNPKAQEQLKRLERAQHGPPQGHFENSFSPDGKKAASILLPIRPGPGGEYNFVTIYDLQEERRIASFDAGIGYDSPQFVWSKDSSKLLISFNSPYGKVVAYDLAGPTYQERGAPYPSVGKLLGEYRTKASKEKIDSLSFSEDGRSVIIKTTDGTTEVWQLP
jgi:hypothetical protein